MMSGTGRDERQARSVEARHLVKWVALVRTILSYQFGIGVLADGEWQVPAAAVIRGSNLTDSS